MSYLRLVCGISVGSRPSARSQPRTRSTARHSTSAVSVVWPSAGMSHLRNADPDVLVAFQPGQPDSSSVTVGHGAFVLLASGNRVCRVWEARVSGPRRVERQRRHGVIGRLVGGLCLGVLLTVTGCSSGTPGASPASFDESSSSESKSSPQPSPSPSATPTDMPTEPPPLPKDAQKDTEYGATQFLVHNIDLYNYGVDTGDWEPLKATFAESCNCDASVAPPGFDVTGGHLIKLAKPGVYPDDDPNKVTVRILVKWEDGSEAVAPTPGATPIPYQSGKWALIKYLEWKGGRWVITGVAQEPA